jgi:hypothetical protein
MHLRNIPSFVAQTRQVHNTQLHTTIASLRLGDLQSVVALPFPCTVMRYGRLKEGGMFGAVGHSFKDCIIVLVRGSVLVRHAPFM